MLNELVNDARYAGLTPEERIESVNAELSAEAASVDHIKELERKATQRGGKSRSVQGDRSGIGGT